MASKPNHLDRANSTNMS